MEIEAEWLFRILWTDESYPSLSCDVNTQNCGMWLTDNSHEIVQEDTVSVEFYMQMLPDYAILWIKYEDEEIGKMIFMQDGARSIFTNQLRFVNCYFTSSCYRRAFCKCMSSKIT